MSGGLLGVLLLGLLSCALAADLVPLLGWSNSKSLSNVKSDSDLQQIISEIKFDAVEVVVILNTGDLSFDDLVVYGGVYGEKNAPLVGLQSLVSQSASSLSAGLSGQQPASQLTTTLSFAMSTEPRYSYQPSDWPELSGRQLIVMRMPQGKDEATFRKHASLIKAAVSTLAQSNLPYAVFYTGDHASEEQTADHHLTRRAADLGTVQVGGDGEPHLCVTVDDRSDNCTEGNNTCPVCLLFCMRPDISFRTPDKNNTYRALSSNNTQVITKIDGACNTTGTDLFPNLYPDGRAFSFVAFKAEFTIENTTETINKTLVFTFVRGECNREADDNSTRISLCGFWAMQFFAGDTPESVTLHEQFHQERVFPRFAVPLTSKGFTQASYACGNNSNNNFTETNMNGTVLRSFQFVGIQAQPFTQLTGNTFSFGVAFNCQGYLGTVSFMGVVSLLILLVILYMSSVFIFSIVSIDRFDNPREPTIKVENLH